jgi:hypothetical protein
MKGILAKWAILATVLNMSLFAQTTPPKPVPGIKPLEIWVGNWTFTGTAKDSANDKEHPLTWRIHGHWRLGGHIVQTDQEWTEDNVTTKYFEVISYRPASRSTISYGVGEDGTSWITTLVLKGDTGLETGTFTLPDGKTASATTTWSFTPDRLSVTATQEWEQDGSKWVSLRVKGTKAPSF